MDTARLVSARARGESQRYELGDLIATGGMAVIHRAFDHWTQRHVAYKRLRIDGEGNRSRMTALFQREYDTLARLKHPNIVEVYDYAFDEQGPYYAMELLSGDDLSKLAPLSYREACRVLRDVASALALVHARRFLHRDVSPNNVRLTREGVAKLIDFGALTPFGRPDEIAGTPAFIAPECLEEVQLDQRSDLYSLGALAYWTLTRRTAVHARSIADLETAWRVPVQPPSSHVLGLPASLDELVMSLLSHDPRARPSSAGEVIERLSTIGELAPEESEHKVAYSYLKHPPLVGREDALSTLRGGLASLLEGRGGVLVVEAASGLGKSALLDQFAVDAQLRGATVLRADGGSAAEKHGVARELIRLGQRIFPDLEDSEALLLGKHQPGGQQRDRAAHPVEALERSARSATRLRDMLLRLSERSPLAILLDDADRADEESIALLASMAQELGELPILLVLSSGTEGTQPSLTFPQLAARARKVLLSSFDEAQVVALIGNMFGRVPNSGRTAVWLHGQTGGNPAQCVDLLRLLLQRGLVRYTRGTFTLPHDVDAQAGQERRLGALLTRLSGLSDDARRVFELVCLQQGTLHRAQLSAATNLSGRRILLAVEQLFQRELVFQRGPDVSLRGESMRAAIEQSLSSERKQELHSVLARAAARHSDGSLSGELAKARHLFLSGPAGELQGAELMARLLSVHGHEISISAPSVPLLESALQVFRARGVSELHCAPLLAALSSTGFYGNITAQGKYLRPALNALSQLCGFTLARSLRPKLGVKLALWVGLVYGFFLGFFLPRKLGRTSIRARIEDFLLVASAGMAAACAALDAESIAEIVAYLEPIAGFPVHFAPSYSRDFCLATAQLAQGESLAAARGYGRLLKILERPRFLLERGLREQLVLGSLNGKAHAEIDQGAGETLRLADELERRSPFFAPHAETLRVVYYAVRGQQQLAEQHRARAETLALRGGVSWTSASVLAVRTLEPAFVTDDAVAVLRISAELERLSAVAPSLLVCCELSRAQLALLRGKPAEAAALLERTLAQHPDHPLPYRALCAAYAEALNRLGRFAEAREVCLSQLVAATPEQQERTSVLRAPYLPLARAEAGLGQLDAAERILEQRFREAEGRNNPLELGLLHGARARIAIVRGDQRALEQHCAGMIEQFKNTGHPALTRQRDALIAEALNAGMPLQVPAGFSWVVDAADELDGATVVEARPLAREQG
ncbi:MAG: putative serine/threonine protein kinase [Myxococcaceae bacterium]|nr:putative serine/threonine protein kinase [Myxococcaceae bacterium]